MMARATFPCQGCREELVIDWVHVHCECGALLWEGDQYDLSSVSGTILENHPEPLCAAVEG